MERLPATALVFIVCLAACGAHVPASAAENGTLSYDAAFFAASRPDNAFDVIKRVPGFALDNGFTDQGQARGFAGAAGNVLIDGKRPTAKNENLDQILQRIPAGDVARVDVIRGGAPGIDMQGKAVIANVIRRTANATTVVANVSNRFFLEGRSWVPFDSLEYTRRSGDNVFDASLVSVPFFDDALNAHGRVVNSDAAGNVTRNIEAPYSGKGPGVSFKGGARVPLAGGELATRLLLQTDGYATQTAYDDPTRPETFRDRFRYPHGEVSLNWTGPLGPSVLEALLLQNYARAHARSTSTSPERLQQFEKRYSKGETIGRATLRYVSHESLTLEGGGEAALNFLRGRSTFFVDDARVELPAADARVEERRAEVFAQATWKLSSKWLVVGGARYERSTIESQGEAGRSRSFSYPKPRLVVTWTPVAATQIRARYEHVVGQINFNDFIASSDLRATGIYAGNADLKPDTRRQYEIAFERNFWDGGAVVVGFMREDISDVIDYRAVSGPSGVFQTRANIGDGSNDQVSLKVTLPFDRLGFTGGRLAMTGTWNSSEVTDPFTGQSRGISRKRPQTIEASLTQDVERLRSTWGINFYNGWDEWEYFLAEVRHRSVTSPYLGVFWEFKPTRAWSFELLYDNAVPYLFSSQRTLYPAPRGVALNAAASTELFTLRSVSNVRLTIRRTFE